ncbi:MAG: glycosyltransferase family 39 protein [Candidatus Hydrogenedentota bacterium]
MGGLAASRVEAFVLRVVSGLALVSVIVMVLGSYSLDWALGGVVIVLVASIGIQVYRKSEAPGVETGSSEPFVILEWVCLAGLGVVGVLTLISAFAPVTSWDAGVAHLALLDGNVYSVYPQALHSLFTLMFFVSGEGAVTLLCWCFGALACGAIFSPGQRLENRVAGLLAAAFLATSPISISQVGTVAIDMPFAGIVLGVLLCVVCWQDEKKLQWLLVASILAGFGCGVRHPGYLVVVLSAIGIAWSERGVRSALMFSEIAAVSALPWFLRSYLLVGNPVYPMFESMFPQEVFAAHQRTDWGAHETVESASLFGFFGFSFDMVMHPDRYDGWPANPGGWVWILGIPGVIMGGRVVRALALFSLVGVSCFYMLQRLARYATAFFVPMMAVAGVAGSRLSLKSRTLTFFIAAGIVYGCVLAVGTMYFKVPVAFGIESREDYLIRRVDHYEAFAWVNENIPEDARILTLDQRSYFLGRPTFQNLYELPALKKMTLDEKVEWFEARGIRYIFLPEEIAQEAPYLHALGMPEEFLLWEESPEYFRVVAELMIAQVRGEGDERVLILEVLLPPAEAN